MTEAVAVGASTPRSLPDATLNMAIALWFVVTVAGQWVFLYYLVAFYGPGAVTGDLESWNRHPMAGPLYVPGDLWGNIAFAAHVALAAIITFGGALQLIPQIRRRVIAVHRWNGRVFMVTAMLASLAGLYMVWFRADTNGKAVDDVIISVNGLLILAFCVLAWRAAAARNIASHRRWALRTFMVVNGVFWLRLGFSAWIVITQSEPSPLTFYIFTAASYLLPLAFTELYLATKERGGAAQVSMAGLVFAATLYMAVGIFGFMMIFVRMILGGAGA